VLQALSMYDPEVDPVTEQAPAMSVRALIAMLLLSLALSAEAREARLAGPGGDGADCSTDDPAGSTADIDPARAARRVDGEQPVMPRGADSEGPRGPRWHSFLPGMFR